MGEISVYEEKILSFPVGGTAEITERYLVHAHPVKRGFPKGISKFITLRKKGGFINEIYLVTDVIEIYPTNVKFDGKNLSSDKKDRIIGYIRDREKTFGFGEDKYAYRFYLLEKYKDVSPAIQITPNPRSFIYHTEGDEIFKTIKSDKSSKYLNESRKWLITVAVSGDKGYNIFDAAEELDGIWWTSSKATKNIEVNDIVYMYVGVPYSKIMYKFVCTSVDKDSDSNASLGDKKYWNNPNIQTDQNVDCFKLEKIQFVDDDSLSLKKLNELKLVKTHIQGSFKSDNNTELFSYIDNQFMKKLKDITIDEYYMQVNKDGDVLQVDDVPCKPSIADKTKYHTSYKRNPQIGRYAIQKAGYKCEIDSTHKTFISRGSGKPYLESHHLVPMSAQSYFKNSLDVPANMIALCSSCHNEIHYGENREVLIRDLYNKRKDRLLKAGIDISVDELIKLYI